MSDDWEEFNKEFNRESKGVLLYCYERTKHSMAGRIVRDFQSLLFVKHVPGNYIIWAGSQGREKLKEVEGRYPFHRKEIYRSSGVVTYVFTNMRPIDKRLLYEKYLSDKAENFGYE